MTRKLSPEIPLRALRDHGKSPRVDRVWRRLEPTVLERSRSRSARSGVWLLAAAAGAALFAAGVGVGTRLERSAPPLAVVAETPVHAATPAGAAPAEAVVVAAPLGNEAAPSIEATPPPQRPRPRRSTPHEPFAAVNETWRDPEPAGPPSAVPAEPEWARLAAGGEFEAARAALEGEGGFGVVLGRASSAPQLLSLADIARATGQRDHAVSALKRLLGRHGAAAEAPLAAWTLGNLLEQAGDRLGAAEAYATYRRLSPAGDFAEDAAARQVDVAISQGNVELAARALEEYQQHFARGRRLGELRTKLAALAATLGQAPATLGDAAPDEAAEAEADETDAPEPAPAAP